MRDPMDTFAIFTLLCFVGAPYESVPPDFPVPTAPAGLATSPIDEAGLQRIGPYCGSNSLYLFLNLCNTPATLREVRARVTTTGRGASLAELKRAAQEFGLEAEVIKTAPEGLRELSPPLIVLIGDPHSETGHYVVLCAYEGNDVWAVDGTTGEVLGMRSGFFNREFSGYALHVATRNGHEMSRLHRLLSGICAVESVLLVCLLTWWFIQRIHASQSSGQTDEQAGAK